MYIPQDELIAPLPPLNPGKTPEEWRRRRKEILDLIVDLEYGGMPPQPESVRLEPLHMARHIGVETYKVHINEKFNFLLQLFTPPAAFTGKRPVLLTGDACYKKCNEEVIADANRRGFIVAKFNRNEFAHDMYTMRRDGGIYEMYPDLTFGALSAWAWGYSRALDALEQIDCADATQVAITGHSRGGKTILLAGATDERIAYTNPNNSGAHGCGCWRYVQNNPAAGEGEDKRSERLADLTRSVPYWLGPEMPKYNGRDGEIPHDMHFFKALVAPRCFLETEALADVWSNPRGSYLTYLAAKEVYRFLGAEDNISAFYREGGHNHGLNDFITLLDFCDCKREGRPLPEGYMRNPFPGLEKIYDWEAPKAE